MLSRMSGSVPLTERPLGEGPPQYHVAYKALLDYNQKLGLKARVKRSWAEVPPLLSRVWSRRRMPRPLPLAQGSTLLARVGYRRHRKAYRRGARTQTERRHARGGPNPTILGQCFFLA